MGGSFGVAVLATVLIQRTGQYVSNATAGTAVLRGAPDLAHARLLGFHDAFLAAAIVGLIGVGFAFMIRDEDAAATMRQRAAAAPEEVAAYQAS